MIPKTTTTRNETSQIGMTRSWRSDSLVLGRIAGLNRQGFLPVLPITVCEFDRYWRSDGLAVTDAGKEVRCIFLDAHAAAATIALLAAPEFPVDELQIDRDSGRKTRNNGDQGFPMRFSGSVET